MPTTELRKRPASPYPEELHVAFRYSSTWICAFAFEWIVPWTRVVGLTPSETADVITGVFRPSLGPVSESPAS
jgi:hypothetical protein